MAVAALDDPPTESKATEMSLAERLAVPLKRRCSRKCVEPRWLSLSSREPTPTETETDTDGAP